MAVFIPDDKVADVMHSADIVEVIGERVPLKKEGKNYRGLCPFHGEKTPSFSVSSEKQVFYCFGCGVGGNVYQFLMKHEGITFPEAVKALALRYGIEIPSGQLSPLQKKKQNEKETVFSVNREAASFFQKCLFDEKTGKRAREYLFNRGMDEESIKSLSLGYAPEPWDSLLHYLESKNITAEAAEKAGLVVEKKKQDGYYDRFRNRVIFPIFDTGSRVIGFGARTLDGSTPKYLNTPETSVYSKSDSLYGIHLARKKGRETGHIFVVEGYFDFLSLYIRGVKNTVATLGTALTSSHAKQLKTCCKCAVLVFDSDEAGIRAAKKGIGIFKDVGMEVNILVLPTGYDPDKFILEKGPEELQKAKDNALSGMNFLIGLAIKKHGLTIEGKIKIVSELASALAEISDSVERSLYIKELSQRIDVEETAIREKISREADEALRRNRGLRQRSAAEKRSGKIGAGVHTERFEKKLIAMLLQYPDIVAEMRNRNLIDCFENPELKTLGQSILEYVEKKHSGISDLIQSFSDDREKNMIASLSMGDEFQSEEDCLRLIDHFQTTVYLRDQSLLNEIKESYSRKDTKNLQELMLKKLEMARRMQKKTSTH